MGKIPQLIATSFLKVFETGRTKPCVFGCEDINGNYLGEYVVKLYSRIESGKNGLLNEIVASKLAKSLDLKAPEPALIEIRDILSQSIEDQLLAQDVLKSPGLNFGSKNITGGYMTWPANKSIPYNLRQKALEIFTFDVLIENPDRRVEKPNLLWKDEEIYLIDHELAFSFLFPIIGQSKPSWIPDNNTFKKHVFYQELKEGNIELDRILGAIEGLSDMIWNDIEEDIPKEWKGDNFSKIKDNINLKRQHLTEFMNQIRVILT